MAGSPAGILSSRQIGDLGRAGAIAAERPFDAHQIQPASLDLRMVYGLNCYGLTLAPTWLALGAQVANGALGVNWFPEPSLSVFLRRWLGGSAYSEAVVASNVTANRWWRRILRSRPGAPPHPWLVSSQQVVYGRRELRIDDLESQDR